MKKSIKDIQMKKSLGRIIILFLLLINCTYATELAKYKLYANKTSAYTKEAVIITFKTEQKDYTDNMMFSLKAEPNSDYKIILLNKEVDDKRKHHASATFSYLLFGLREKEISVHFDFIIRTASDAAVTHSFVDDHDDSIATQTHDTHITVKPLKLLIKKLAHTVDLVGDFTLDTKMSEKNINQYESVNIVYTLQGKGYEEQTFQPISSIYGVTIFSEVNDLSKKNTKKGYAIKREYIYAMSAKSDFIIPELELKAYSPTQEKYYTLKSPKQTIHVNAIKTAKLLDNEEYPIQDRAIDIESIKNYFIYLMIFLSGYITAKIQIPLLRKRRESKEYNLFKQASTPKALLFTIITLDKEHIFTKEVQLLEDILYKNIEHNFKSIKKKLLKKVKR